MKTLVGCALVGAVLTAAPGVRADMVDATEPETLVSIIQDLGYRAKLGKDGVGDPLIESSVGGRDFGIAFYGCDAESHDQCEILLFAAGIDLKDGLPVEVVNKWNAEQLVGRAYLDDEDDPWLELSVIMKSGVSRGNFESTFRSWEQVLAQFEAFVDQPPPQPEGIVTRDQVGD